MNKIKVLPILVIVITVLVIASVAYASPAASQNFAVPLSGREEVPPRDTNASGQRVL